MRFGNGEKNESLCAIWYTKKVQNCMGTPVNHSSLENEKTCKVAVEDHI